MYNEAKQPLMVFPDISMCGNHKGMLVNTPFAASEPRLRLAPGPRQLELQYTGLSFVSPRNVAFKYRLAGLERDWVEAGARRTAYYSRLPPGDYRFEVMACNNDGVWNEAGASLAITVLPHFWQTWWFIVPAVLTALGAVGGTARQVERRRARRQLEALERQHAVERERRERQQAMEKERARIAADLHDDLGARLTELSLLGSLGVRTAILPERDSQRHHRGPVGDGLMGDIEIGLWETSTSTLLASTVITNGTGDLVGSFRGQAVTAPVTLKKNTSYTIAGHGIGTDPIHEIAGLPGFVANGTTMGTGIYGYGWPNMPTNGWDFLIGPNFGYTYTIVTNPVANASGPYFVLPGGSLSLIGTNSVPSDGQTLTAYDWDLNNDGTFGDATGATPAAISHATLTNTYFPGLACFAHFAVSSPARVFRFALRISDFFRAFHSPQCCHGGRADFGLRCDLGGISRPKARTTYVV